MTNASRSLLRDVAWALLIGAAIGASPHTSGRRLLPKLVGGVLAAAIVFGYRVVRRRRTPQLGGEAIRGPLATAIGPPALWAVLLLYVAVFVPTAVWLYGDWTESIWRNGHGLFVSIIVFWLSHAILRRDAGPPGAGSAWGLAFVFVGLALAVVGAAVPFQNLSALGLVVCLPGLSLLILGTRRTRALALPLCLSLLLVPLPTSLAPYSYLPTASATGAAQLLELVGVPVLQEQTTLGLTRGNWIVSNRCSGFSVMVAAFGLAAFLAVHCKSWRHRVALLLAVWPLVAILNSIRTFVFALYLEATGINLLHTPLHGGLGIATFWGVMGGVLLLAGPRTLRGLFR